MRRIKIVICVFALILLSVSNINVVNASNLVQLNDYLGVDDLMAVTNQELIKIYRKLKISPPLQVVKYSLSSSHDYYDEYEYLTNDSNIRMFVVENEGGRFSMITVARIAETEKALWTGRGSEDAFILATAVLTNYVVV